MGLSEKPPIPKLEQELRHSEKNLVHYKGKIASSSKVHNKNQTKLYAKPGHTKSDPNGHKNMANHTPIAG